MLNPDRHEVALHVANNPYREWKILENETKRKVNYYTIHGTSRLFAQLLWRRKRGEGQAKVPSDFPLKSFHDFPKVGLDVLCYANSTAQVIKIAETSIARGEVLHIHPEWLFQRGKINHRGPFYDVLKSILEVNRELETLSVRKIFFSKSLMTSKSTKKVLFQRMSLLRNYAKET